MISLWLFSKTLFTIDLTTFKGFMFTAIYTFILKFPTSLPVKKTKKKSSLKPNNQLSQYGYKKAVGQNLVTSCERDGTKPKI